MARSADKHGLHVTHHLSEAERLGDMILVLRDGKIQVKKSSYLFSFPGQIGKSA